MSGHYSQPESWARQRTMLRTAMGPAIGAALADPTVIEVMVNPDGSLRLDRLGEGRVDTGERLKAAEVERIIRLVASYLRVEVHANNPVRSEGHTSELQSLMRISYAVFCLKKQTYTYYIHTSSIQHH